MSKPVEVEFLMKDKLTPGMNKAEREALELRNTVRLLEAELERLRLAGETAAPNLDQSANIAQIHALEKQLEELRGKLKLLQEESESVQVTPADMPNAQRQFNGLHNSIQQMAREMPSLAMGPQMFFLAISNNLPIFTDELARARKEYDELQKSGKKGTPVWKQVLSSLFSWQTAMTTGIMLLVMYGDEIWDWTKNLFSAKKGVDEFNISLKEMTEIEKDGRAQMVRTRFELKSVIDEIKNFTGSKEQEKAKVEELNRKYGESFGYYKTLSEWYDTLIQKSEDYVQVLLHQTNVQNLVKKAAEADEEVNKIKAQKPEEAESAMGFFGKWGQYIMQSSMAESGQFYDAQAAIKKHDQEAYDVLLKNAENKRDGYLKKAEEEVKKAAEAAKKGNIGGHIDPKQSGQIFLDGREIAIHSPADAIRQGVVLAPEDRKKDGLCTKLSIRHNIALPNLDLLCNRLGVVSHSRENAMCDRAVRNLQIKTPSLDVDAANLSGGNQQKVVVAKWLARNSRVVLFDEPTRGIDVAAKVEIYHLMNQLKQQGIAVMFVSSELPEVLGIADRVIVMCDGQITGEVMARKTTQNEILTLATRFENKMAAGQ